MCRQLRQSAYRLNPVCCMPAAAGRYAQLASLRGRTAACWQPAAGAPSQAARARLTPPLWGRSLRRHLGLAHLLHRLHHLAGLHDGGGLQLVGVRGGHVLGGQADDLRGGGGVRFQKLVRGAKGYRDSNIQPPTCRLTCITGWRKVQCQCQCQHRSDLNNGLFLQRCSSQSKRDKADADGHLCMAAYDGRHSKPKTNTPQVTKPAVVQLFVEEKLVR